MGQQPDLQTIVQRMVEAGEPESNIALVIQHYKALTLGQPTTPAGPSMQQLAAEGPSAMRGPQGPQGPLSSVVQAAKDHPATAGALLGSLVAAPVTGGMSLPAAMAFSGLMAGGGAAYGDLAKGGLTGNFGTPSGNAADIAENGIAGAAGEGLGRGANAVLKGAGRLVYRSALAPSMALQRDFGDISAAGLKARVPVSTAGEASNDAALTQTAQTLHDVLVAKDAAMPISQGTYPQMVTAQEIANRGMPPLVQDAADAPFPQTTQNALTKLEQQFVAERPSGMTLLQTNALKRKSQDLAASAYKAAENGAPVNPSYSSIMDPAFNRQVAFGARQAIEDRAPEVIPLNQDLQMRIGLGRALENAGRRNPAAIGFGPRTWLGGLAPNVASRLAIGADMVGQTTALPASIKAALVAALGGGGQ